MVSTESEEFGRIARGAGYFVIDRPQELAEDHILTQDVLRHAVMEMQALGESPDYVMCLQPDVPFRTAEDINEAIRIATRNQPSMVLSYRPFRQWPSQIDEQGKLVALNLDRSDLYRPAGVLEMYRTDDLLAGRLDAGNACAYIPPMESCAVDIDTLADLHVAEAIVTQRETPEGIADNLFHRAFSY